MDQHGRPRRRSSTLHVEPSTITECARRYHACAVALAKSFGLPLTADFLQAYHAAISCVFIEAGRSGVRLPERVRLPPLAPAEYSAPPVQKAAPVLDVQETAAETFRTQPEPDRDSPPPGAGEAPEPPSGAEHQPPTGDAPLPTRIPREGDWPCAGQEIRHLKPAQLHLLVSRAGFRAHTDTAVMPLLAALQVERAQRLEAGRRPKLVMVEGQP